MNYILIFLPVITLILSQQTFCSQKSTNNYRRYNSYSAANAYENQDFDEILRGHNELLKQMQAEQNAGNAHKENIIATGRTTPLKGSTDKVNEKR